VYLLEKLKYLSFFVLSNSFSLLAKVAVCGKTKILFLELQIVSNLNLNRQGIELYRLLCVISCMSL